jgi:hypothetical protein
MRVSPVIWRKRLMDSISGNLGYHNVLSAAASAVLAQLEESYEA